MIRRGILVCAFILAGGAAVQLLAETRYVAASSGSVATVLRADSESRSGVVFVFQPEDCLDGGDMIDRWNRLYTARRFPVTGRVVGDGRLSDRQKELFHELKVQLPVRGISPRDASGVAEKLGYTETPFAVILDEGGRVAGSFPAGQNIPVEVVEGILRNR